MAYQFKSKTMQQLQTRKQEEAKIIVDKVIVDYARTKQAVEELTGERGSNRAVRRKDFETLASVQMVSQSNLTLENLYADVQNIYKAIVQISNILGTAKK